MSEARSGPVLVRATKCVSDEDPKQTWSLFLVTLFWAAVAFAVCLVDELGPLRYLAALILGLINIRIFIFYHDALHGAIFRKDRLGKLVMKLYGLLILTPPQVWKDSHNYHHAHTSKIIGASIGSYPIMTVRMYKAAPKMVRFKYRAARHWLNISLGYFTVFLLGMCIVPLFKSPRRNMSALASLGLHYGVFVALGLSLGWGTAFIAYLFPQMLSCAMGSYLFYAQHTFPDMELRDRRTWEYTAAALHSSSMMNMPKLMHWFTGNIGYHHVHHLNSKIPFYRLPEAMETIPELANPHTTSLSFQDIRKCLQLHLWDTHQGRMLTYREALGNPS